ncbi:MAG: phosphatase PAP2 family protein [Bacteroides sp.]|nr:phosphatase PAP2 family protein [Bacteroides sp.]MCM1378843.1 phosphatase PAP2 family protein [Bacteroides sp.]MCM1445460.1 phosphatase PAP2 family protein [Prevotella sp.]
MPNFDEQLLLWCNGYHTPWLDSVMMAITGRWIWIPLYALLAGLLFWRCGWKRAIVYLLGIALTITLTDQLCASWIRPWVGRLRPCDVDNPLSQLVISVNGYAPQSYSFPSCHAANTFALAMFLSLAFRNRGMTWFLFLWAATVSYSRLYLGVHHPGDILVGAIIGMLLAWGVYYLCNKVKFGKKAALALFIIAAPTAQAQKFEWGGEFATIFDNREGNAAHTPAQTYFLTRLAPEIGVSFANGTHRVMGGVVYTQPIGCEWDGHRLSPTLYYRYDSGRLKGSMGMFPRTQLLRRLPEYLVSDSTEYFQHNLRGALLQYTNRRGFFEILCDWRGMQTTKRREAFAVIAQGEWQPRKKIIRLGGTAMLNHLAKVKNAPADQYVVDNMIANAWAGLDFKEYLKAWRNWQMLELRLGALSSLTRDRADGTWRSAVGLRAELDATFWRFTLRNVAWVGNRPLYPLYDKFGPQLSEGEPYYSSRWYNRTELSGLLVSYRKIVDLRAELDFHWADRNDFMFYQRLILTVTI